ncbi:hypothetical protein R1sor_015258 [Riccia sorocarpa]|uniref:Uncharacterized protein n=1 Tax=Riccia sorocarpa TaxID=122646 RepID=A0ABD3HEQ4_9MARC
MGLLGLLRNSSDGETVDSSFVSGYQACLWIEEKNELLKINLAEFEHRQVILLPDEYNGNMVFELPPTTMFELAKKDGEANRIDWPKKVHCEKLYDVGLPVSFKTHICGHCGSPPLCDASCEAKMYYVIPKLKLDVGEVVHMSRIAIHVGSHTHPHRRVCTRSQVKDVKDCLNETLQSSRTGPLANIPHIIVGDINTTSRKRKGQATSTIHPTDTHRHDRVAVTTQVKRTVRGRLSFDFEPPQHAETELRESSRPPVSAVTVVTTLSSSKDDSVELDRQNDVTDSQPVQRNLEMPL